MEPGQPAFNEIKETFGQSVIDQMTGKIVSELLYFMYAYMLIYILYHCNGLTFFKKHSKQNVTLIITQRFKNITLHKYLHNT